GLLDEQVMFLEGFFSDTLPTAPLTNLALIRLDGDLYESTRDSLVPLYPKLSDGGFCIIDDYYAFTDCQRAVDEYRTAHGITAELVRIDKMAVYWRK
ncbi:MAG TPA: TylF/MycF/NovP-related O-methyltransferase, partial [Planctomycetaceae bacterium]|nr:TylF/MycF/NovP-related O-methyltransferase [Planctomycetaceae bacterium]